MTEEIEVKVGQIWADNDKRFWVDDLTPSRFVRVEGLTTKTERKKRFDPGGFYVTDVKEVSAARVVLVEWDRLSKEWVAKVRPDQNPRYSTIVLRRFRPNATGYRLWEDV